MPPPITPTSTATSRGRRPPAMPLPKVASTSPGADSGRNRHHGLHDLADGFIREIRVIRRRCSIAGLMQTFLTAADRPIGTISAASICAGHVGDRSCMPASPRPTSRSAGIPGARPPGPRLPAPARSVASRQVGVSRRQARGRARRWRNACGASCAKSSASRRGGARAGRSANTPTPARPTVALTFFRVDRFAGEPRNLVFADIRWVDSPGPGRPRLPRRRSRADRPAAGAAGAVIPATTAPRS